MSEIDQLSISTLRALFLFPLSPSPKGEAYGTGAEEQKEKFSARNKEERKWVTREVFLSLLKGMKIYKTGSKVEDRDERGWKPLRFDVIYRAIDPQTEMGSATKSPTGIWFNFRLSWSMFVSCMLKVCHKIEENKPAVDQNDNDEGEQEINLADLSAQAAANPDVGVIENDWKSYNPTDVELQEVQDLFFYAGYGKKYCMLDSLQLALYMNRFLHSAVCEIMKLAEMLCDTNGGITAVNFARALASYRVRFTKISEVSFGMQNNIRLVLVRCGDPTYSLQVAHTLRQNVFLSLQAQVHKMGGEMNVEHVLLNNARISRRNQMKMIQRRKSNQAESTTSFNPANASKMEMEMTEDDLIDYCEICRTWAAHVWVCFIFDESVYQPSLPPKCTTEQFEKLSKTLQMIGEKKAVEALNTSFSLYQQASSTNYCLEIENYHHHSKLLRELQRLSEDPFRFVAKLKTDASMYDKSREVHMSEFGQFQQLAQSFLSPNDGCSAMMKVEKRFPVFVILRENAESANQQDRFKPFFENILSRIPSMNKFHYKVSTQDVKQNKPDLFTGSKPKTPSSLKGTAMKLNKLSKMNSIFRNSSIHSPKKLKSMLDEMYQSDSDISNVEEAADAVLSEKQFLQRVAKEVKAMLSQALIRAIPPAHMIDNTILHEKRIQSILYMLKEMAKMKDASGRMTCPVDNEQLAVVRAIVKYIDHYEYSKQGDQSRSNMEQAELMEERGKERKR
eukprot:768085-Hanusia_phi.AAC.2